MSGSPDTKTRPTENVPAFVEAWYGGEQAGNAIDNALLGDYNPSGRLPVTFYKTINDLPSFEDYAMAGKTYRYFDKEVKYPFGYGLSYSSFEYGKPKLSGNNFKAGEELKVNIDIKNTSEIDGEEVVQLYITYNESKITRPIADLRGFERVQINGGETKTVEFVLDESDLEYYDEDLKEYVLEEGTYTVNIGGSFNPDHFMSEEFDISK
jgi:beta-glucosidase